MFTRRMMTILLAAGFVAAGTAVAAPQFLAARAEEQKTMTAENASLFLPEEYEQYLDLDNPSHVAMSERYLAASDGQDIYVFDRTEAGGTYRHYVHQSGVESVTVGKMQFSESDRLYFTSTTGLYALTLGGEPVEETVCSFTPYTFQIEGSDLFVVTTGDNVPVYLYRFGDFEATLDAEKTPLTLEKAGANVRVQETNSKQSAPLLTCADGFVYCAVDDGVRSYDAATLEFRRNFYLNEYGTVSPVSVCAANGALYYTDRLGLHRSDMRGNAERVLGGENFGTLTLYGGVLYYVQGKAIRAFDLESGERTAYEISSSSDSPRRLNTAKDIARAGDLLVIADTQNDRVSVFDRATGTETLLPCASPTLVATDGKLIAFSSGSTVWTYEYGSDAAPVAVNAENEVNGLACVYGTCYYTTQHRLGNATTGASYSPNSLSPSALTADLYGNLYVAQGQNVYRFSEEGFLLSGAEGTPVNANLPERYTSLRADFAGNLYYLDADGALCKNGAKLAEIDGADFVYNPKTTAPVSFALGFEDDEIYFCFGNYVIKSDAGALAFPALNTLDASGVYEEVFAPKDGEELELYDVSAGAIGIRVALSEMTEEDAYLPYADYSRTEASARGVLLTDLEIYGAPYHLIALYEDHRYTVEIFRADACTLVEPKSDYWTERSGRMYIASEVSAYYFPCLVPALAEQKLERGTPVTLLATVSAENGVGYDFAYVEYETNARSVVRGYVPLATLSNVPPNATAGEDYFFGWLKKTEGGVTFLDEHGDDYVVAERTYMRFTDNGDGTYTAHYTAEDGTVYTALVTPNMFERGESDAWRIALIIILSVLALVIIGAYIYLLPWEKKKKSKKKS